MTQTPLRHILARGAFHVTIGVGITTFLFFCSKFLVVGVLGTITIAFFCIEVARLYISGFRQWFTRWLSPLLRKGEENELTGSSYFLIGTLITILLFPKNIALLAILFLSLGDPVATIIGTWKGRQRLWRKTLEGNFAFLSVCLLTAIVVAIPLDILPFTIAAIGAVLATVLQALPLPLDDNITIPVGSAATMLIANTLL